MALWAIFGALVIIVVLLVGLGVERLNPHALAQKLDRIIGLLESIQDDAAAIRAWTDARHDERDETWEAQQEAAEKWLRENPAEDE
ncbi:MAG: hypothetical protein LAO77_15940 [Acidobacteriia bacterium]|nr:hypothetical protein [Terriglobia bacterium]